MNDSEFKRSWVPLDTLPNRLRERWTDGLLREGYVAVPKPFLRALPVVLAPPLGIEHLVVALVLLDYQRPNLTRPPSVSFIAFGSGLSRERVKKCLRELLDAGLVTYSGTEDLLKVDFAKLLHRAKEVVRD